MPARRSSTNQRRRLPSPGQPNWTAAERTVLERLRTPMDVQLFLDDLDYHPEGGALSPRTVLRTREAQCFTGAVFAASALRRLGHEPRIIELVAENDDDHLLAVFQRSGLWGAVGKSNFTTLRFREPVYRSLRELVMSYFDFYFNINGEKSMRSYSVTLDLSRFDSENWQTGPGRLLSIEEAIENVRHYRLMSAAAEKLLEPASKTLLEASMIGSNPEGLFQPS